MHTNALVNRAMIACRSASNLAIAAQAGRPFPENVMVRVNAFITAVDLALEEPEEAALTAKEALRKEIEALIKTKPIFKTGNGARHLNDFGIEIQTRLIDAGFTDSEIAEIMEITVSAVTQRRARLMAKRANAKKRKP